MPRLACAATLVRHLEPFLIELGGDFAFMGRQKRLRVEDRWYRVDLVFYHQRLSALVLIDLKLPNKVLAAEYQTALPEPELMVGELRRTRRALEERKGRDSEEG